MNRHMQIDLPDESYQAIATLAAQKGVTPEMLAEIWLAERQESELVRHIKATLPHDLTHRYRALISRREAGTLTPEEHAELLQLNDQIELFDAKRVELLIALSQIRGTSLASVMADLGIGPHSY